MLVCEIGDFSLIFAVVFFQPDNDTDEIKYIGYEYDLIDHCIGWEMTLMSMFNIVLLATSARQLAIFRANQIFYYYSPWML